jgi:alkanesulfonate monooxygenase SsuD/methylene tetrahydromethanopterin reductase-like flavin-dependent oxidoreductase (luciferase family)
MNVSGSPAAVKAKIDVLQRHCRDVGRNPDEIEKTAFTAVIVSENEKLIERVATMMATGSSMSADEVKKEMPIGSAAHVRDVIGRYADVGVSQIIMMAQAPWRREIYQRVNEEIVAPMS